MLLYSVDREGRRVTPLLELSTSNLAPFSFDVFAVFTASVVSKQDADMINRQYSLLGGPTTDGEASSWGSSETSDRVQVNN